MAAIHLCWLMISLGLVLLVASIYIIMYNICIYKLYKCICMYIIYYTYTYIYVCMYTRIHVYTYIYIYVEIHWGLLSSITVIPLASLMQENDLVMVNFCHGLVRLDFHGFQGQWNCGLCFEAGPKIPSGKPTKSY